MSDAKHILRDQARKHRTLTDIQDENPEDAVAHLFDGTIEFKPETILAAYWPTGREFDVTPILEKALAQGITCALPVIEKDTRILKFVKWDSATKLVQGPHKVMQPENATTANGLLPDIVITPLLAFDRRGYRLGQGGGYYDATLSYLRAQKEIIAIGAGYAGQAVLFPLPVESHDQKMDYILTPKGLQNFRED